METTFVPVIQGLITVAGTLGGTWLGTQLSKGREERQWRRDRCLTAYAEVLTLAHQVCDSCEDPSGSVVRDPEKQKLLWAKYAELALASQKSALIAPSAVQERIVELVKMSQQMVTASAFPANHRDIVWVKWVVHHAHLGKRVMRAARRDLGSAPPSQQYWWRRRRYHQTSRASQYPVRSLPETRGWAKQIYTDLS